MICSNLFGVVQFALNVVPDSINTVILFPECLNPYVNALVPGILSQGFESEIQLADSF